MLKNLESSSQLTDWMESVETKYPISSTTMVKNIIISMINICLGIGAVAFEFCTDWVFTDNMKSIYKESLGNQTGVKYDIISGFDYLNS